MKTEIEKISEQIVKLRRRLWTEAMKGNHNLMQEILGCEMAKRGIEIAAVSGNSIGFVGGDNAQKLVVLAAQYGLASFADRNCPCGNYGSLQQACNCSVARIHAYQVARNFKRVKECDLVIEVPEYLLTTKPTSETFDSVLARVLAAQEFLKVHPDYQDTPDGQALWKLAIYDLGMQAGRITLVKGIAKAIAALDRSEVVQPQHVAEALQYAAFSNRSAMLPK